MEWRRVFCHDVPNARGLAGLPCSSIFTEAALSPAAMRRIPRLVWLQARSWWWWVGVQYRLGILGFLAVSQFGGHAG
jgi:hypothetical protein